ncbi:MAG: aconitase family protein [Rhodospirillales bacterium]
MGMTAVEKILARASGMDVVKPDDIIFPNPDMVIIHDGLVAAAKEEMDELEIKEVFDPDRVYFVTDHDVIYTNPRAVERGFKNRIAAKEWGIKNFYDAGKGGHGHIFPLQRGIVVPGMFIFDNDRHCTNVGGAGAVAFRIGHEVSTVLSTGTMWTQVPKTIKLSFKGKLQPGVYARDVGFVIASGFKKNGFFGASIDYRVLELAGELDQFSLDQRVALASSPTEMRAISIYSPPSEAVIKYYEEHAQRPFEAVYSDPDAEYEAELELDIGALEPQVALMGGPHNAAPLKDVAGKRIDHAFIGSCGSGMWEDLEIAAAALKGNKVADGVRLFIVPGTEDYTKRLQSTGMMGIFLDAGAFVLPASCGMCASGRMGPTYAGEVSISTAAGNQAGRFGGDMDSELLLGSPATVAASAVRGEITDPRTFDSIVQFGQGS